MKKNNIRCHVLNYHIVWCTKYRFKVLKNKVEAELKELLESICSKYGYDIVEIETMPDHVHLFVSIGVSESPADVVRTLKSISARELFKKFPGIFHFAVNATLLLLISSHQCRYQKNLCLLCQAIIKCTR